MIRGAVVRALRVPKWLADFGLRINRRYYRQLFERVYCKPEPGPSWFDHRIDLHYLWPQNLFWLERGSLPRQYMVPGCAVLDLFCGDGFYSRYFYSTIAGSIDAVDKDPAAIEHARWWHAAPNIQHHVLDLTQQELPSRQYDVILWFEGIEHLSREQYVQVVSRVKSAMGPGSILFGSTCLVPAENRGQGNWEHQNEFSSSQDLREFLEEDFADVQVFVTDYPVANGGRRRTAYFVLKRPR